MLDTLRAHAQALRDRGVTGLWIFGSVARGEARSDVDLLAEFDPDARLSLVGLASLRAELSELPGASATLVERSALRPPVRDAADREAVRVLWRGARERLEDISAAAQDALDFCSGLDAAASALVIHDCGIAERSKRSASHLAGYAGDHFACNTCRQA